MSMIFLSAWMVFAAALLVVLGRSLPKDLLTGQMTSMGLTYDRRRNPALYWTRIFHRAYSTVLHAGWGGAALAMVLYVIVGIVSGR